MDVDAGRIDVLVSEPQGDDRGIDPGVQQPHSRSVAKRVRSDGFLPKSRTGLRGCGRVCCKAPREGVSAERLTRPRGKHRQRPARVQGRTVFVRLLAPLGPLSRVGVTLIVAAAARRAGLGLVHAHPRRASVVMTAKSRSPARVRRSQAASRRRTSSGSRRGGSPANRRPATDGTAAANECVSAPLTWRKPTSERSAVAVCCAARRDCSAQRVTMNAVTSASLSWSMSSARPSAETQRRRNGRTASM